VDVQKFCFIAVKESEIFTHLKAVVTAKKSAVSGQIWARKGPGFPVVCRWVHQRGAFMGNIVF
jgi:hypothetical protein